MSLTRQLEPDSRLARAAKPSVLALSILIDRIGDIPKADRDDLFELLQEWRKAEGEEEQRSIQRAMEEILAQTPVEARPLPEVSKHERSNAVNEWAAHVGRTIRGLRRAAGLNQTELAAKAGLTQSHVSRLENGEHHAANFTLEKLATALDVPIGTIDPNAGL